MSLEERQRAMKLQLRVKRGGRQRTVENPMTVDRLMVEMRDKLVGKFWDACLTVGKIELAKRLPENPAWPDFFKALEDYIMENHQNKVAELLKQWIAEGRDPEKFVGPGFMNEEEKSKAIEWAKKELERIKS